MLALMLALRPAIISGLATASRMSRATSSGVRSSPRRMANSSPPRRAASGSSPRIARSRAAISTRTWSPAR